MDDYTDIDNRVGKLRALAEAATPGPWQRRGRTIARNGCVIAKPLDVEDAEFIAACSPDVILALTAELVGLRTEVDQLRTDEDEYWRTVLWLAKMRELSARFAGAKADEALGLLAERDAARAEVATLTEVRHADAAERDALQAQLSEMTTYRNDWQRRAQQAEQDRNDEHDRVAALQARIDAARHTCENAPDPDHYGKEWRSGYARATAAIDGILSGAVMTSDFSAAGVDPQKAVRDA